MKARVKATGEIVEVTPKKLSFNVGYIYETKSGERYVDDELDLEPQPDYWEKLLHQYAGMAMQGLLASGDWDECSWDIIAEDAIRVATALVEKLKDKEDRI